MSRHNHWPSRRNLLLGLTGLHLGAGLGGRVLAGELAPTPACDDPHDPTPRQTAGPFYTPQSPQRASLRETGLHGEAMRIEGWVLDTRCRPIGGAWLDLWHADAAGEYDNDGFRCRGHTFTDAAGRFRFETIVAGQYPGRTRHYHVKIKPPGEAQTLTTQLYFPDEPHNARDGSFDARLLMDLHQEGDERIGRFDFVLALA